MSPRKRRRDQAFAEEETESPTVPDGEDLALSDTQRAAQMAEKEQEVWDAIREAHYEAIEQLPLTLQRQLSLMRQLDEQSVTINARLLPTLQRYIAQRQAMAADSEHQPGTADERVAALNHIEDVQASLIQSNVSLSHKDSSTPGSPLKGTRRGEPLRSPKTPSSESVPPESLKPQETTRSLLSHIARMSEELLRASQEKVNLAQANHDSVERHIRLLDQAIKEQEASLDQSRLTSGIAIHLPELVPPEWPRKSRNNRLLDDGLDVVNEDQPIFLEDMQSEPPKQFQRASKKKGKDRQETAQAELPNGSSSLTITLPAIAQQDEEPIIEELYCYCNRVSFGQMIACDNDSCEKEWFHLGCVGLTEIPEGEWYCEDCRGPENDS